MTLRERLQRRDGLLGCFNIELRGRAIASALAQAGFDVMIVDCEHSAFSFDVVADQVTACRAAGIGAIVRVPENSRSAITRVAELAPDAIMCPGVGSADEAREIVTAAKYAPLGQRGVAPMVAYSALPAESRYDLLNERQALILQIEGAAAVEAAAEIAAVPGVDGLFVGTYDLSQSLGIPGQLDDPRVFEAGRGIVDAIPADCTLGVYVQTAEMARDWRGAGATLLAYATDGQLLLAGARAAAAAARS
jgi:2-keto-3-deoxy-L-rhamnonate aldolase RhmA